MAKPPKPVAQTSLVPLPPTASNNAAVPVGEMDHALPFQWSAVPFPTAQTSVALVPHTAFRSFVVPLAEADHALPFQCRIVPASPTAQTSFAPLPHTPRRVFPWGSGLLQHHPPTLQ